jgi:hypothetical protein
MNLASDRPTGDAVAGTLRFGGRGQGPDGASVVWSVAEGSRGRRWREVRNTGHAVASSLLLETDAAGHFAHLELSTPSGLLTLHPEGDGTLHGNAIVSDGVEHVEGRQWDSDGIALLEGSTVCRAAAIHLLGGIVESFTSRAHLAVVIPPTLWLEVKPVRVERIDDRSWRFGVEDPFAVDGRGLPVLRGAETWPLERDSERAPRHR